ncbi:MAG: lipopolysaccharide biosynthesis protein [Bryobacteraceae bacterium]
MDVVSQALTALRWNAVVRLSAQGASWAITVVVMRLLTPDDYGLLAMTTVFLLMLSVLAEFGVGAAIVQAHAIDEHKLRQIFGVALLMNFGAALVVFSGSPLIARFYDEPALVSIVRLFSIQFVMNALMVVPRGLLQRKLNFKGLALIELGATISGGLLTLLMAFAGLGVWSLIAGNLLNLALQVVGLNFASPFLKLPIFSFRTVRTMVTFGASVTGTGLLWSFWSQADSLIAGRLLGRELLGAYAIGAHVVSIPLSRFSQIVSQVAFSTFSRLQDDPAAFRTNLTRSLALLSVGSFPLFWGLSSVAQELIAIVLGPRWSTAVIPITMLALVTPLRLLQQFTSVAARAAGRVEIEFRNTLITALVMPASFYAGCLWGGLEGLCSVWITVYPLLLLWNLRNLFGALGLRLPALLTAALIPGLAAAAMYLATTLLRFWVQGWLDNFPRAVLLTAAGAAVYLGLMWTFDRTGIILLWKSVRTAAGLKARPQPAAVPTGDAVRSRRDSGA